MFIRILPTTLLQIFCENLLHFQVIFKSMKVADDTSRGTLELSVNGLKAEAMISAKQKDQITFALQLLATQCRELLYLKH